MNWTNEQVEQLKSVYYEALETADETAYERTVYFDRVDGEFDHIASVHYSEIAGEIFEVTRVSPSDASDITTHGPPDWEYIEQWLQSEDGDEYIRFFLERLEGRIEEDDRYKKWLEEEQ